MKFGFGIDVGGTTVKLGLFTQAGELLEKWEIPTNTEHEGEAILPDIARAVADCMSRRGLSREDCLGMGIGVPGPVSDSGIVNKCANLGWGVFDLHKTLGDLTGLPVKGGNDANVAALGECWKGGGQGHSSMVLATLGTGIGGGIVIDGKILFGAHGAAGEIGHVTMDKHETEPCGCGKFGCAEEYGSASGLTRLARRAMAKSALPSPLRALEKPTAKDVFDLAAQGDALALEVREAYFDVLGQFLAGVCCVVDPEIVVLGGGVSKAGPVLAQGVQRHFVPYMFHTGRGIRFALATLGNDAGIYGSFKLALDQFGG